VEQFGAADGTTLAIVRQMRQLDADGYALPKAAGILIAVLNSASFVHDAMRDGIPTSEGQATTLLLDHTGQLLSSTLTLDENAPSLTFNMALAPGFEGTLDEMDRTGKNTNRGLPEPATKRHPKLDIGALPQSRRGIRRLGHQR
jgi:hypothetical protein